MVVLSTAPAIITAPSVILLTRHLRRPSFTALRRRLDSRLRGNDERGGLCYNTACRTGKRRQQGKLQ
ncbi:MAG: hypothetical protein ACR2P4_09085 [Gammaproteobacteria bacterium]